MTALLIPLLGLLALPACRGTFEVSNDRFVLDGRTTRLVGCEIHYFRIPVEYWRDRLERVRALGCDSIQIYVPWNFHEPAPGVFDWHGERDIAAFIKLASKLGLHTLLRPGPYICAEWEMGGLPAWLLDPGVVGQQLLGKLRSADATYLKFVSGFWQQLFERIAPLVSARGGPVLMVQVENEYGFFNAGGDTAYVQALWQMGRDLLGNDTVLYTTDPPWVTARGGTYDTVNIVDFGVGRSVKGSFQQQREANLPGQSPPMCSEFYTGWLTHWGERMARTSAQEVATTLRSILHYGGNTGSVVLYMAHGGTNFGFWAGANGLLFDVTSYDYDCPIRENAWCGNDKFKMLQRVIADATGKQLPTPAPDPPAAAYGTVHLTEKAALVDNLAQLHMTEQPFRNDKPGTMEENGFAYGAIEYWATIECQDLHDSWLYLRALDLAHVRVNGHHVGTLWRAIPPRLRLHRRDCPSTVDAVELAITVFAYGRDNFFKGGTPSALNKGIVGDVVLRRARGSRKVITGWRVAALPLVQPGRVLQWGQQLPEASTQQLLQTQARLPFDSLYGGAWHTDVTRGKADSQRGAACAECWARAYSGTGPTFHRGNLRIDVADKHGVADTYVHTSNFARGFAWVNGHNLGRFWTRAGPQQALFVPKVWLRPGDNEVVILEIEIAVDSPRLDFTGQPDFSGGRLSQQGAPMLGGLLRGFWESMHDRGHERFFMLDTLKRAAGIM